MIKQLFISDLDGTLLQPDATLSDYSRKKIIDLIDRNVNFTIATARSITSVKEILKDLPLRLPIICANGGSIYDYKDSNLLKSSFIKSNLSKEIINEIKERDSSVFVSSIRNGKEELHYDSTQNFAMDWFVNDRETANDHRLKKVKDIRTLDNDSVTTLTFMNRKNHLEKVKKFYLKEYGDQLIVHLFENKYSPGWYWLSLHSIEATKGNAVHFLKNHLDITDHKVTVFGDEKNDIPMFKMADKAIAVQNALPSVKNNATEIIGYNSENAVVDYIHAQQH